jgi:hypothetical protein
MPPPPEASFRKYTLSTGQRPTPLTHTHYPPPHHLSAPTHPISTLLLYTRLRFAKAPRAAPGVHHRDERVAGNGGAQGKRTRAVGFQ